MEVYKYFNLTQNPFRDTVNPKFFFQTEIHEKAYFRMKYCIEDERAIGLVTGPSGSGKTLLSQLLLRDMDPEKFLLLVILCSPQMTKTALLREILGELEVEAPSGGTRPLLDAVHQKVLDEYQNGRRVVLLVDESHFLSSEALHLLRTISNLETSTSKLVTTILFAEDFFLKRLKHPRYASLRGRISQEAYLNPLSEVDTEHLMKFRILVAGGNGHTFTPDCYQKIYKLSRGVPREISRWADNALLEAMIKGKKCVDVALLEEMEKEGALSACG